MSRVMRLLILILVLVPLPIAAQAQPVPDVPDRSWTSLSGPRFGVTVLSGESARIAKEEHGVNRSMVTQFGWQFERRFLAQDSGPSGVFELVLLAGGLEQGAFFPSVSWITGIRTESGVEFGAGPNATPLGLGLAAAAGVTLRAGQMNFPLNVALVSSQNGVRTSVLGGFTIRR
jgi:hypothetical protein